jgi:hypothetical protein
MNVRFVIALLERTCKHQTRNVERVRTHSMDHVYSGGSKAQIVRVVRCAGIISIMLEL